MIMTLNDDKLYLLEMLTNRTNNGKKKTLMQLLVSSDKSSLILIGNQRLSIEFKNVIGIHQFDDNGYKCVDGKRFRIFYYPLIDKSRRKVVYAFEANTTNIAKYWVDIVKMHFRPKPATHLFAPIGHQNNRKVIVFINPFSGQCNATKIWKKNIVPFFEEAEIPFDLLLTEKPGHAKELASQLQLSQYNALVIVSGDGLIMEVINGFLKRKDWRLALKMPICHIPGGTGNGLAAAICYQANEPFPPRGDFSLQMSLMLANPYYLSLKLCHVETSFNGHLSMFMSVAWGLVADIDIGSERFRWIGLARFHIESALRIAQLPTVAKYRARISYIPVNDKNLLRKTMIKYNAPRGDFGENHFDCDQTKSVIEENWTEDSIPDYEINQDLGGIFAENYPEFGYKIPRLCEPVPSDWTTIEGNFLYVTVNSLSHLGSDLPYLPSSKLDENVLYLTMVDWKTLKSRAHVCAMMASIDKSRHLRHPCMQIIPVKACRVEPLTPGGYSTVDGEPIKTGPFQVCISSLRATVIGREQN